MYARDPRTSVPEFKCWNHLRLQLVVATHDSRFSVGSSVDLFVSFGFVLLRVLFCFGLVCLVWVWFLVVLVWFLVCSVLFGRSVGWLFDGLVGCLVVCCFSCVSRPSHRLVGLVVRRPPRERKIPGSNPACAGFFGGSSHTSDFKIGTPVATLLGAWRYRTSAGTGRPGVSIL